MVQRIALVLLATVLLLCPAWSQEPCPLCGQPAGFPDTPDGLLQRMKAACLANQPEKIQALLASRLDPANPEALLMARVFFLMADTGAPQVDGDRASFPMTLPREQDPGPTIAERRNGHWIFTEVPFLSRVLTARDTSLTIDCRNNLKQLGVYLMIYVSRYGNDVNYPTDGFQRAIVSLPDPAHAVSHLPEEATLYHCKHTGAPPDPAFLAEDIDAASSYAERRRLLSDRVMPDAPVMWDKKPHPDGTRNVMRFDGSVDTFGHDDFGDLLTRFGEPLPDGFAEETASSGGGAGTGPDPIHLLRSLVTAESTWRQVDADRNTVSDYWTADVSGLFRAERLPAGSGVATAVVSESLALADYAPLEDGAAVPGAEVPGAGVSSAGMVAQPTKEPLGGYWYAAVRQDESGGAYATDPDGDGRAWTNTGRFAFCAFPAEYGKPHRLTYLVNEAGVIWSRDLGKGEPVMAWPGANPGRAGWKLVQ